MDMLVIAVDAELKLSTYEGMVAWSRPFFRIVADVADVFTTMDVAIGEIKWVEISTKG